MLEKTTFTGTFFCEYFQYKQYESEKVQNKYIVYNTDGETVLYTLQNDEFGEDVYLTRKISPGQYVEVTRGSNHTTDLMWYWDFLEGFGYTSEVISESGLKTNAKIKILSVTDGFVIESIPA